MIDLWMLVYLSLLVCASSAIQQTFSLTGPTIARWKNQDDIIETLVLYNVRSKSYIKAQLKSVLPQSYSFNENKRILQNSDRQARIYDFSEIEQIAKIDYVHFIKGQTQSKGVISSKTSDLSEIFSISAVNLQSISNYHQSCSYISLSQLGEHLSIYEIESSQYREKPTCNLCSPMTSDLYAQNLCLTKSPQLLINNKQYIKEYTTYTMKQDTISIKSEHEFSQVNLHLNHKTSEVDYFVIPTSSNRSFLTQAKVIAGRNIVEVTIQNLLQSFNYVYVQCIIIDEDICDKSVVLKPKQIFTFQQTISHNNIQQITLLTKGFGKQVKLYLESPEIRHLLRQSVSGQQQSVIETNVSILTIILIVVGVVIFCIVVGCIVYRIKMKKKSSSADSSETGKQITFRKKDSTTLSQVSRTVCSDHNDETPSLKKRSPNNKNALSLSTLHSMKQIDLMPAISDSDQILRSHSIDKLRYLDYPELA